MGKFTTEITRGRSCVKVDRNEFCGVFDEKDRYIVRTSKTIDRANHKQTSGNIESVHKPAKVGHPVAKVAGRLDVEPYRNEEEDREPDNLDENSSFQDEPRPLQFIERK